MTAAESLRHAALEVLATRPGAALPLDGIRRRIATGTLIDEPFDDAGLRAALAVLIGLGDVALTHDRLGSTEYFQATANGVIAFERGP